MHRKLVGWTTPFRIGACGVQRFGRPSFRVRSVACSANVKTNTRMIAEVAVRKGCRRHQRVSPCASPSECAEDCWRAHR